VDAQEVPIPVEQLFREHRGYVKAFLTKLGVPMQALDDATQEVFLIVYKLGGYRKGPASQRTWLGEITLRVAANTRRKFKRKGNASDSSIPLDRLPSAVSTAPDVLFTQRQTEVRVQAALNNLTELHREVFLKFYLHGETCSDIALELGIPTGTVYSRLHMARAKFNEAWTPQQP